MGKVHPLGPSVTGGTWVLSCALETAGRQDAYGTEDDWDGTEVPVPLTSSPDGIRGDRSRVSVRKPP